MREAHAPCMDHHVSSCLMTTGRLELDVGVRFYAYEITCRSKATTTMGQTQGIMIYFSRSSIHHNGDHHPEAHEKPTQLYKPLQPVLSPYGDDDHQCYKHGQLEWHEPLHSNHGDSFTFGPRSASHYLPSPSCLQHDCIHWTIFILTGSIFHRS